MGRLEGLVAIVTGAGSGLGREHALLLATEGAAVVVNDLGGSVEGEGRDKHAAQAVADEITAAGGSALADYHDVGDWSEAGSLVEEAIERFERLDILVNNAGILRDRTLAKMTEAEWDAVIRVHLKGHAAPTAHALRHWRAQSKAGHPVNGSVVHTTSLSGLVGGFGQANYASAKAAVLGLSAVVALEGASLGVRSNAVSPSARTRLTLHGSASMPEVVPEEFDYFDPANVSPLIAWLACPTCPATGQVFHIAGDSLFVMNMPQIAHEIHADGRWSIETLERELAGRMQQPLSIERFFNHDATTHGV